jgi:hypothetical protein
VIQQLSKNVIQQIQKEVEKYFDSNWCEDDFYEESNGRIFLALALHYKKYLVPDFVHEVRRDLRFAEELLDNTGALLCNTKEWHNDIREYFGLPSGIKLFDIENTPFELKKRFEIKDPAKSILFDMHSLSEVEYADFAVLAGAFKSDKITEKEAKEKCGQFYKELLSWWHDSKEKVEASVNKIEAIIKQG